jgi:hypothetical protein
LIQGAPAEARAKRIGIDWQEYRMSHESVSSEQPDFTLGPIAQFAIKTGIVAAACFMFFVMAVTYLDSLVDARVAQFQSALRPAIQQFQSATQLSSRDFWAKLEGELEDQASPRRDLSPAKKKKILTEIGIVSDRWRPFVMDVIAAITGDAGKPNPR